MPQPGHHVRIEPARGWELVNARELWRYRELLFFLAWRDVKVRYKQAVLGVAWAVLQPLMLMVVFTVFLAPAGGFTSGDKPQPLFILSGLVAWYFFASAVGQAAGSVVGSERLITKVYFPRLAVPFAAVGASAFDFLVGCGLMLVGMAGYGLTPGWNLLALPVVAAVLLLAATGVGTLLAALTVAYRDFRYVTPFLLQLGLYSTTSIYRETPPDASEAMRVWLNVNPLVAPVEAFRACLLGGAIPWGGLAASAAVAGTTLAAGCLYYRRLEAGFADTI